MTREEWLLKAVDMLSERVFKLIGEDVPTVRVSVGWPGGRGNKSTTIGQCWSKMAAADEVAQIFISPVLHEPVAVLETLAHELVHAVDNCESGHKGNFRRIATAIGLEGKMTSTHAGEALGRILSDVAAELGDYPHAALTPAMSGVKKQTTRMIKCECPCCGYIVRTTAKWLEVGMPYCPSGTEMAAEEKKEGEEG